MTQLHSDLTELVTRPNAEVPHIRPSTSRVNAVLTGINDMSVLATSIDLTSAIQGSLTACFVPQQIDPYSYSAFIGPNALPGRIAIDVLTAQNEASHVAARQAFDAVTAERAKTLKGCSVTWRGAPTSPEELGLDARLMDYVVLPQPRGDNRLIATSCLDAVLYRARRSALLVPSSATGLESNRILIAFNGSAEAARAVTSSLPILQHASKVDIVSVGKQPAGTPTTSDLRAYLAIHGISSGILEVSTDDSVENTLARIVTEHDMNLIVMGAYTHSHLKHKVLGGLTTYMLENAKVPVLMAH